MPTTALATRVLTLSLAVALVAEALLDRHGLGVNVPVVVAFALLAALAIRPAAARFDLADAWLPVATIVVAVFLAVRDDAALTLFNSVAAVVLGGASIAALGGASVTRATVTRGLRLAAIVGAVIAAGAVPATTEVRSRIPGRAVSRSLGRWTPVARGVAIGAPIAMVVGALFSEADPIFGSLGHRLTAWDIDLSDITGRLLFMAIVAWMSAGLLWLVARQTATSVVSAGAGDGPPGRRLGTTEVITVLVVLDALFATFVVLQVAYLFGGVDTLAASGMTYANYARRGFFELLIVGFLTGALISVAEYVVVTRTRVYVALLLTLVGLTGAVLASSLLRLRLYQDAYGWTELRFYVLASIVFLAVGFAAAAALIVRNRSRWLLNVVGAIGVIVFLGINVVGPQAYVTQQNLARALNPSLVPPDGRATLDTSYLASLGADSVPQLVDALPRLNARDQVAVRQGLESYRRRLESDAPASDRLAWNLARERARAALASLRQQ